MAQYGEKKNELEERGNVARKKIMGAFVAAMALAIVSSLALVISKLDVLIP